MTDPRLAAARSGQTKGPLVPCMRTRLRSGSPLLAPFPTNDPVLLARSQCVDSYGTGEPYQPIFDLVETLWRIGDDNTRTLLRRYAPTWLLQMPELAIPTEIEELRRAVPATTSERMERELVRALEAVSAERLVVLAIDRHRDSRARAR